MITVLRYARARFGRAKLTLPRGTRSPYRGRAEARGLCPNFPRLHLIHIAPDPRLTRFNRANQRVVHFVKVFSRVLVLGRITTPHMPARQTQAQMDPCIAHLDAFFANMYVGVLDFNLVEMRALILHSFSK